MRALAGSEDGSASRELAFRHRCTPPRRGGPRCEPPGVDPRARSTTVRLLLEEGGGDYRRASCALAGG